MSTYYLDDDNENPAVAVSARHRGVLNESVQTYWNGIVSSSFN